MATLSFTQDGTRYIAEATVNHPYALHLEREDSGKFMIYQRSTDTGQYVPCSPLPSHLVYGGQFIDWTFDHGHYPMHLRFESESAVASATLQEEEDAK